MAAAPVLPHIAGYRFDRAPNLGSAQERAELSESAIRGFLNISEKWGLSEAQKRALLGGVASSTLHIWRSRPATVRLSQDTLTRISLVVGIYKALHIYFSDEWADRWITLGNRGPLFGGQAPVEYMLRLGQPGMLEVRRQLDSWRGGR